MLIEVGIDEPLLNQALTSLRHIRGGAEKAILSAVNDTARKARTMAINGIAAEVMMKKKFIGENIRVRNATNWNGYTAVVEISGKRIPLIQFGARKGKRGVTYRISRRGGRKTLPGSFLASMVGGLGISKGGTRLSNQQRLGIIAGLFGDEVAENAPRHEGVFKRRGKPRLPITELRGPSIPGVFRGAPALIRHCMETARNHLADRVRSKIEWVLSQQSQKGGR